VKIKTRYYAGGFPLEGPLGIRGVGRMRNHRILWCMVAQKVTWRGTKRHWCDVRVGALPPPRFFRAPYSARMWGTPWGSFAASFRL